MLPSLVSVLDLLTEAHTSHASYSQHLLYFTAIAHTKVHVLICLLELRLLCYAGGQTPSQYLVIRISI